MDRCPVRSFSGPSHPHPRKTHRGSPSIIRKNHGKCRVYGVGHAFRHRCSDTAIDILQSGDRILSHDCLDMLILTNDTEDFFAISGSCLPTTQRGADRCGYRRPPPRPAEPLPHPKKSVPRDRRRIPPRPPHLGSARRRGFNTTLS